MIIQNKQSSSEVFEMILKSVGNTAPVVATARRDVPAGEMWRPPQEDGQLAVDVVDRGHELVILSTMAGADPERIEVYLHNDLLTIRGERRRPLQESDRLDYLHEECFWGLFSRTVVLPVDVQPHRARAEYKNGVLIVSVPKRQTDARVQVMVVDE